MAISDELTRIQNAKADIKASIEAKGVTVPSDALIDTYDTYIGQISGGGGGQAEEDLKNLIERDITSITIPNGTTTIGNSVFYYCKALTSVTIPNSVTTIGNGAFQGCTSLTNVVISDSVTSIGVNAFLSCTGLTSITIPSSVTDINQSAFQSCTGLTSITIPNSVTTIGNGAFTNCRGLTEITVKATTPPTLGSNTFGNTNDCPIYVPAESIDAYNAASGWSSYASRIQASIIIDDDMETGGTGGDLYTIADTVVEGEPGARITANTGDFVGYYNSEGDAYYDTDGKEIDMAEYMFDFGIYLEDVYGITSDSGGGF